MVQRLGLIQFQKFQMIKVIRKAEKTFVIADPFINLINSVKHQMILVD